MTYKESVKFYEKYDEEVLIFMAKIILVENNIEITDENIKLAIIQGAEKQLKLNFELN